jgi:hypothetical protein
VVVAAVVMVAALALMEALEALAEAAAVMGLLLVDQVLLGKVITAAIAVTVTVVVVVVALVKLGQTERNTQQPVAGMASHHQLQAHL